MISVVPLPSAALWMMERTQLLGVQEVLRKMGFGQCSKAQLVGEVFDDEAGGSFWDQVAEPWTTALGFCERDDRAG